MAEVTRGAANVNINRFKERLRGGGARPNLFEVVLDIPGGVGVQSPAEVQRLSLIHISEPTRPY